MPLGTTTSSSTTEAQMSKHHEELDAQILAICAPAEEPAWQDRAEGFVAIKSASDLTPPQDTNAEKVAHSVATCIAEKRYIRDQATQLGLTKVAEDMTHHIEYLYTRMGRQELPPAHSGQGKIAHALERSATLLRQINQEVANPTLDVFATHDTKTAGEVKDYLPQNKLATDLKRLSSTKMAASLSPAMRQVIHRVKQANEAGMTLGEYAQAEQQANAQMALNELQHTKAVAAQAQQQTMELQQQNMQLQQQTQQLSQENASLSQQQQELQASAMQTAEMQADAEARAAEQANAKLRMKVRIQQMRQTLADLAGMDPAMEEAGPVQVTPPAIEPPPPAGQEGMEGEVPPTSEESVQQQQEAANAQQEAEIQTQQAQVKKQEDVMEHQAAAQQQAQQPQGTL